MHDARLTLLTAGRAAAGRWTPGYAYKQMYALSLTLLASLV